MEKHGLANSAKSQMPDTTDCNQAQIDYLRAQLGQNKFPDKVITASMDGECDRDGQ